MTSSNIESATSGIVGGQLDPFLEAIASAAGVRIDIVRIAGILLFALFIAVISELVNWHILYSDAEYLENLEVVNRLTRKLDALRESLPKTEKNNCKVKGQEDQLKAKMQELQWPTTKAQLVSSVVYFASFPLFNRLFGSMPVAELPFEPMFILRSLAQRGLKEALPTDCSASYLFILAGSFFRTNLTYLVAPTRLKGNRPATGGFAAAIQQAQEQAEAKSK